MYSWWPETITRLLYSDSYAERRNGKMLLATDCCPDELEGTSPCQVGGGFPTEASLRGCHKPSGYICWPEGQTSASLTRAQSCVSVCVCVCKSPGISWRGCIWSPPPQWDIPSASCSWPRTGQTYLRRHKERWAAERVKSKMPMLPNKECRMRKACVGRWASHWTLTAASGYPVRSSIFVWIDGGPGLNTLAQEPKPRLWPSHPEKR